MELTGRELLTSMRLAEGEIRLGSSDSSVFRTGLSFEIPEGHAMLVFSRSGFGFKNNIRLSNCVGVIDSMC